MQSLKMAIKSIMGNKMRAFLTMLGIIIGVVALVVLVSLVSGTTDTVTDTVSSLGSDLLSVTISDDKGNPVSLSTLKQWEDYDDIGRIAAVSEASCTVKSGSNSDSITVYGTTQAYYEIQNLTMYLGRFLLSTDVDNNNYVCVINEATAQDIIGYKDCLGEEISIDGMKFTIAGVLADDDSSLTSMFGSGSYTAYIPYTTMMRISTALSSDITSFYLSAEDGGTVDDAESAITDILYERFDEDEDAYEIVSTDVLEDALSSITDVLTFVLGGIAAISLLVGGIGIMNIMLVTVTERTREIGIRKAVGASRGVILRQFLLEAIVICMIGCGIGILLSWTLLTLIGVVTSSLSLTFDMNITVVLVAVGFCFLIGVIFGLYPANKAAKMKPIDALHYGG